MTLLTHLAVLIVWRESLTDDRDGYLALADGLAAGRGFSVPGTQTPTAYRPPLYPLLLVPSATLPSGIWVALLHLGLSLLTVWLTWTLALRLAGRPFVAALAALLVAVDPLLLRYTALPMTETLATCLVTALLVSLAPAVGEPQGSFTVRRSLTVGLLFGLTALTRPTVWAFAALWGVVVLIRTVRSTLHDAGANPTMPGAHPAFRPAVWVLLGAAVVLLPWGVRNVIHFGQPILMTTHGGYTLLLGNNPNFVREVVDQPWGTVWDGSHGDGLNAWVASLHQQLQADDVTGEVAQDRWLRDRALAFITQNPTAFARACWLRLRRFWGLTPIEGASDAPDAVRMAVGLYYVLMLGGAIVGLVHVVIRWSPAWLPSLLMLVAFNGVHLVYWTNIRMRAPVTPVLAILAAAGWSAIITRFRRHDERTAIEGAGAADANRGRFGDPASPGCVISLSHLGEQS